MAGSVKISIVISNYNYGRFLPDCLDSIRAQTYPHLECVVVDDGSTDNSREVIARYPEFRCILKSNAGQASALADGFQASTGSVIVFLDADDFLFPEACSEIARLWAPDLVSLHYRLQIQEGGVLTDRTWPADRFRQGDEQIDCLFRFGYVPAAPTSGNAYARHFVSLMFEESAGVPLQWLDSCFAYSAPLAGETRHCDRALGAYRVHDSNLTGWKRKQTLSYARKSMFHSFQAQAIARRLATRRGLKVPRWDFLNGPYDLKLYLLTRGSRGSNFVPTTYSALACAIQSARGFLGMRGFSLLRKGANVVLVFLFAAAPHSWRRLIAERFYNFDFAR